MRYYSTQHPVMLGGYPKSKPVKEIVNYDSRKPVEKIGRMAWGYIEYDGELSEIEAAVYELLREGRETQKLEFNKLTENLIEISQVYVQLMAKYKQLSDIDSTTWKQEFVEWANEFEEQHRTFEYWEENDYFEAIENFAMEKMLDFAGIEVEPIYFSFGSWEKFPYQNTYVVVYAEDKHQAIQKFRKRFPDVNDGVVNCSAWYTQTEVDRCKADGTWYDGEPAEIIR